MQNVNCVKTTLLSLAKCNLLLVPLQKKLDATKSKIVFNLTSFSISVMLVFAIVKVNWEQNAEPFTLKVGNLTLKWVVPQREIESNSPTLWKLENFPVPQILREIKIGKTI